MICDNCGQEVDGVSIEKPGILEFWKKERRICQRCAYNKEFGTNLDVEQWNAKINSPPKTEIKKDVASYEEVLHEMRPEWYAEPKTLTHLIHHGFNVETYKVEKGCTNRILGIECPERHITTICGVDQSYVDPGDFAKAPHLYTIPHEFSILCFDTDNNELPFDAIIGLEKVVPSVSVVPLEPVLYGDLSLKIGGRFKRKEERYYFPRGIILYGGEWLFLNVVKSGVTVDRVEFFMRCDFFTKVIK